MIVFSNGVRITFYIAPSRTTARYLKDEDLSIVKIEASPMEACIEMMKKTKWHPLMVTQIPLQCPSPFTKVFYLGDYSMLGY